MQNNGGLVHAVFLQIAKPHDDAIFVRQSAGSGANERSYFRLFTSLQR